jgi:hypothetical protein
MSTTEEFIIGSQTTLLNTELNALANNAVALSAAFNNAQGQAGSGYTLCDVELYVDFGSNSPAVSTACTVWFLMAPDGTNYEDYQNTANATPPVARLPDLVIPLRNQTGTQRVTRRVLLPWGLFKALFKNDGTGFAVASNNNSTLKIRPVGRQAV